MSRFMSGNRRVKLSPTIGAMAVLLSIGTSLWISAGQARAGVPGVGGQKDSKGTAKAASGGSNAKKSLPAVKGSIDPVLAEAIKTAPPASAYPNSPYARLLDLGTVTVKPDGTTIAEYRVTYKLYKNNAVSKSLAEVVLPYNSSYQELHVLSAQTVKKDGTVLKVSAADIRDGGIAGEYLMYDDAHGMNFSMPGIEDDCVIDYTFQMVTHPMFLPGQFTTYWGFDGFEPVAISRLTLKVPAEKPLRYKMYNANLDPVVTTSLDGRTKTYVWERKNMAPLALEPSMPRADEVKVWMEASSLGGWQDIATWFWGLQQPQARPTDGIRNTVKSLIAGKTTDEEKCRAIYDWVANKTRYVGIEFGISAYRPHTASEVHEKQYGDCKDKANLLITMLGLAGIKAHPVLLHAGERRDYATSLPTLNAFNHCIAVAELQGKEIWLDATAETCAFGDIPDGDRGVHAFVVRDGKGQFETIPSYDPQDNSVSVATRIQMKPDGSASTQSDVTMKGEFGQSIRAQVQLVPPDKREEVMQGIASNLGLSGKVKKFQLPDGQDKLGPFAMNMALDTLHYGKQTGKSLLILPMVSSLNNIKANPFKSEKRTWPIIEEDASQMHSETTITVPEGFEIDDLPGNADVVCAIQEYHRKVEKSADGKTITISDTFVSKPGRIPPTDYDKIRGFYDDLVKVADDQIILKKSGH